MAIATAQDYINQVARNVHDTSNVDFSTTQLLGMVNEARQRVAMDTHCYRQFITGLNTFAQQETYAYNVGAVGGVSVLNGGSNYSAHTAVTFSGGSGSGLSATPVIVGGVITGINMTGWGQGYTPTTPPTVVITDSGGGSGASASPILLYNILDILSVSVLWGSLSITHCFLPFTGFQTFCRAWRTQYEVPAIFTLHQGINKAFLYPIPDQAYPMEWDVITLPTDLATVSSPETQITAPWNDAVQFYATFLAIASLQQYEKAKFWYDALPSGAIGGMYGGRIKQLPATAFSRRILSPYRTYWPMVRKL